MVIDRYSKMAATRAHGSKVLSVRDVVSMIEEDDFADAKIYITPPNDGIDSDEDSADEDGGSIDNLSGMQLRAQSSARIVRDGGEIEQIGNDEPSDDDENLPIDDDEDLPVDDDEDVPVDDDEDLPVIHPPARQQQIRGRDRIWLKRDLPAQTGTDDLPSNRLPKFLRDEPSPHELFNLFFDDEVIDMITEMTTLYASREKGNHSFRTSHDEIRLFLAILLISGYSVLPRRSMYWEQSEDCHNSAVSSSMSRNRFEELFKYLHVADNQNRPNNDKFGKVRPLLSMINERSLLYTPDLLNLSIDESMVPYFGRHSAKQFIRGKPVRFGFKFWVLALPSGYAIQFEPYQGAGAASRPGLGLGGSVVLDLLSELPPGIPYNVIFDNFFTSLKLLDQLTERGISGNGTIRSNRVEKCPIRKTLLDMKKKARGSFDFSLDRNNNNIVVAWNDNNVVLLASNAVGVNPPGQVARWSRKESKTIDIPQPYIVKFYNQFMGGVDRMDQNIAAYRVSMRSKKWWWASFAFVLDLAIQNAWLLYRRTESSKQRPLDLLAFKREIVHVILLAHRQPKVIGRPLAHNRPCPKGLPVSVRTDGVGHYQTDMPTQRRCAQCGKKHQERM